MFENDVLVILMLLIELDTQCDAAGEASGDIVSRKV